jgi:Zn-dependent alcohol dehydrogenase
VTRAQVLERAGAPLQDTELTLRDVAGDDVRVRLLASGVCHSDLHAANGEWTVPLPLVLGHEGAEGVRVELDPFDLADQGKRILGCNYGSSVPAVDFPRLARLHLAGRLPLDRLVGRRRPLAEAGAALADLRDAVGLRTVLEFA